MTDVGAILSLGVHLKTATDLLKNVLDLLGRTSSVSKVSNQTWKALNAEVRQLTAEIAAANALALAAQSDQFTLSNRVRALEEKLMQREDWKAQQERYVLQAVAPTAVAYVLKPGMESAEPPHWLCPQCFMQHRKSVLQFAGRPPEFQATYCRWACSTCGHALLVHYTTPGPAAAPPE